MGLLGGNSEDLKVVIGAEDKTKATFTGFNASFGKMTAAVGLGTIAADLFKKGMSMVESQISSVIKAAADEQVAMSKVDGILKNMNGSFEEHKKVVLDAANAAIKLGIDDEDAAISMAKFLQATNDTKAAQLAMTDAQDLMRLKGLDLETATKMVTLAYAGNVKVLKEMYTIDLPEGAKGLEALGLMHEKVGGQAQLFADTYAGKMEIMKVSIENVKEEIGGVFLPILTKMFDAIVGFVNGDTFKGWIENVKKKFELFSADAEAIYIPLFKEKLSTAVNTLTESITALNVQFGGTNASVNSLDIAIAPLLGLIMAVNLAFAIGAGFISAYHTAATGLAKTISLIHDALEQTATAIANVGNQWVEMIRTMQTGAGKILPDWLYNPAPISRKASGGPISAGMPYLVGERGPEVIVPSQSGTVIPNSRIGGGIVINVNNPVVREENDITRIANAVAARINRATELRALGA